MIDKQEILAVLESPQEEVRLEGVRSLVKTGDAEAARHLKRLAGEDPSPQVRYYAQKGLDHLSRRLEKEYSGSAAAPRGKSDILERLSGILDQGGRDVKLKALQVLALHGFREGLPIVLAHLPKEDDPFVRSKMLLALGMLGGRNEIPILAEATRDEDFRIRANAVEALEYIGHRSIYPPIIGLLQDPDHRVRANAVKALRNYGREEVLAVLDEMLASPEVRMRDAALFASLTFDVADSVPRLARLLEDPAGPLRRKAFHALGRLAERGCEAAARVLSGKRVERADQENMLEYFTLLDQAMTLEEDLPSRVGHTDFRVRLAAIHQIVRDKRADYLSVLVSRLDKEPDGYVKAACLTAVGKLGGMAAMTELTPFLENPDARLRANAIESLGEMGIESLAPKLRKHLQDPNNRARGNALVALAKDPETDLKAVLAGMVAEDELMKLTACYVVSRVPRDELIACLEPLLGDSSEKVRNKVFGTFGALSETNATARELLARHSVGGENVEVVLAREFEPAEAGRVKSSLEVERLLFDLESQDGAVRMDAIRLLADIGDLTALEPLAQRIRAPTSEERTQARQAIVNILFRHETRAPSADSSLDVSSAGLDPELGGAILQQLEEAPTEDAAISAVLRLAAREGRRPVIRGIRSLLPRAEGEQELGVLLILAGLLGSTEILLRYLDHATPSIKQLAREGLEAVQGDRALRAVLPHVRSASRTIRHNAVRALRLFPKAKVLGAARRMLRAAEPKIREGGIYILTKLEYDETFELLLDYFRVEEDLDLARKAAGTIAKLATPADRRLIETLLDGAGNAERAELARKILTKIPGQPAPPPRRSAADISLVDVSSAELTTSGVVSNEQRQQFIDDLSNEDPEVRKGALMELARTGDISLRPLIRKVAFTDPDPRVAFFAKNAYDNLEMALLPHVELKKQGETGFSIGRFTGCLESDDPRIRVAAVKKAVMLGEKKVVPRLLEKIKEEDDEWVLAAFLLAIGDLGDRRIAGELAEFVNRKDPRIRSVAIAALAELKDESAFPLVTPALVDDDLEVALVAFMALRRMSETDLIDYLATMCEARKQAVADRGIDLLLRLRSEAAHLKQLDLMCKSGDKKLLNRLAVHLSACGSREVLLALAAKETEFAVMPNEWTQKVRSALMQSAGMSEADLQAELARRKAAPPEEPPPGPESARPTRPTEVMEAAVESGMVKRLKGFLWKK